LIVQRKDGSIDGIIGGRIGWLLECSSKCSIGKRRMVGGFHVEAESKEFFAKKKLTTDVASS
jgi:hypothetical protein